MFYHDLFCVQLLIDWQACFGKLCLEIRFLSGQDRLVVVVYQKFMIRLGINLVLHLSASRVAVCKFDYLMWSRLIYCRPDMKFQVVTPKTLRSS